jgi:hypothetical protein
VPAAEELIDGVLGGLGKAYDAAAQVWSRELTMNAVNTPGDAIARNRAERNDHRKLFGEELGEAIVCVRALERELQPAAM